MIGEKIGDYEIVEQLGQGAMGTVYRALDPHLVRQVAIKTIRPVHRGNPTYRAAFQREARITSALKHPSIVSMFDVFSFEDLDCIVMEYIAGQPLNRLIGPNGMPLERVIPIAIQIGEALNAAHTAGVVHRDLKPGNIMLQDGDRIKILDFGLGKMIETAGIGNRTRTMSLFGQGAVIGTLGYMAPEQARGESVDYRADIFGMGVLVHQMLSGTLPFRAPNPAVLLHSLLYEDPKPLRSLNRELPLWIEAVVLRALRKKPDDRFQHASEFVQALQAGEAGHEGGNTTSPSVHRTSLSAGSPSSTLSRPPSTGTEDASIAVLPFRSLSSETDDEYLAAGMASELTSALIGVPRLRIASQLAAFRLQEAGLDPRAVGTELNVRYVVSGTVRRAGQRIRVAAEMFDTVESTVVWSHNYDRVFADIFVLQEDISKAIVVSLGGQLIRVNTDYAFRTPTSNLDAWGLARKAYHIWNYQFSVEGVAEAIGLLRRAVEIDPDYAGAHAYLGMYLMQAAIHGLSPDGAHDRDAAHHAVEQACALAPADPVVLENASIVFLHSGEYERAVQCARYAVKQAPYDLVAWGYLAFAHAAAGTPRDAQEALKILDHLIADAPDHPSIPYWYQFALLASLRLERYGDAAKYGQRCYELQPGFVFQQVLLAEALCHLDREEEAKEVLATIPRYNPYFSMAAFEAVAFMSCRSQATVDQFCGEVKTRGLFK